MTVRPKCIIIAGPTATGKTCLSVELALALDGEIVNADSMQVYRGMDIGTAKPTTKEQRGVPHLLLDVVDPDQDFNAATYRSLAIPLINNIVSRQKVCFITGGTGLYIKSLTRGLFNCPAADLEFRESMYRKCETDGSESLHQQLGLIDPDSAKRIHPNDIFRIIRALEIYHLTKRSSSELIKEHGFSDVVLRPLKICMEVDRQVLYKRINERSISMVDAGLADETERLLSAGFSPDLKPMKSIGYRHMIRFLQGGWSMEETIYNMQRDTRRYAKRQLTWFKADPECIWLGPDDFEAILSRAKEFLGQ
ncbi:tRNA dimethylallyltransferase 2 [uncultured Desulfobacterium sp.]|uniref:tRNA dimethylallyltransferase n=1 Tax=uncultured Desulfobacterium sp. TaxID=201089 RepID=A0A445N3A5_9BACT|nr:tRNA dimethylallyltransferase 2 [uncultured Desulfobacterium sp.]